MKRFFLTPVTHFFVLCLLAQGAQAQLATSFYNLTNVETKVLNNAIQVTIRADGVLVFGADYSEITESGEDFFRPRPITILRLRFLRARSKLPAFINIAQYPLDAIAVEPGRDRLKIQFFGSGGNDDLEPKTDLYLRFSTPILVRDFEPGNYDALPFGNYLNPLDVRVQYGSDAQSVIVTIVPDRLSGKSTPPAVSAGNLTKKILVVGSGAQIFRIEAVHAPLGELLDVVAMAMSTPAAPVSLLADEEIAATQISLHLPNITLDEFLRALEATLDFSVRLQEAGVWRIARNLPSTPDSPAALERIPLQNLSAEKARTLLPDFLLPYIRADRENNALLVSGSQRLISRVRRDVSTLDQPRQMVRVQAAVWEIAATRDDNTAIQLQTTQGNTTVALDTDNGQLSLQVDQANTRRLKTAIQALAERGRARLVAEPFMVVASGESGSLFLGQDRFVTVLRNEGGQQNVNALRVSVGYSLNVRPTVGATDEVLLETTPRISTVDDIESGTGLPTLGIREMSNTLRLRPGDTLVLGGMDANLQFDAKRQTFIPSHRDERNKTNLLVMLTATPL